MQNATLIFLIDNNQICLGMKKRGFGSSRWNGFGGKIKDEESIEEAAIREIHEETTGEDGTKGVTIKKELLNKVAILNFTFPHKPEWNQQVHVFFVKEWEGNINESEEMRPEWFDLDDIPYEKMWSDDIDWLPKAIQGEKIVADFSFDENDVIIHSEFREFPIS